MRRCAVGLRNRQRDDGGLLRRDPRGWATSATYSACSVSRSPVISGANAALTARWIAGVARKLVCRKARLRAARLQQLAHLAVDLDVGAPEAVDRLLRVADDEQLAGDGRDAAPVVLRRIVGREQQQDLGLQRIGVLELVDEEVREARLERAADARVASSSRSRARSSRSTKSSAPGALLQLLVARDHARAAPRAAAPRDRHRRRAGTRRAR